MVSRNEDDCLALLTYVSKHREDYFNYKQTQRGLGRAIGVSQQRISFLITSVEKYGENGSVLYKTSSKYGFLIKLGREHGRVLDAEYWGRGQH